MSIKIHHGPPGSYKTSAAVMDDLPVAVREGRPLVTNVRGLTDADRICEALGLKERPEGFEVIHVDTSVTEGLERLRRWFHWAPLGAFLLIDEAQRVWPPAWSARQLETLSFEGGPDAAAEAGRPEDHWIAFDMHRHYNWDLVLTTPSIKKIRPEIRGAAEMAYKHKNLAVLGIPGNFIEGHHLAEDNGNESDLYGVKRRRIKRWVWQCYESTATGEIQDTKAGRPLWKDPKLLGLVGLVVCGFAYAFRDGVPTPFDAPNPAAPPPVAADQVAPADPVSANTAGPAVDRRPVRFGPSAVVPPPLAGWQIRAAGSIGGDEVFEATRDGERAILRGSELRDMGYRIRRFADCLYRLTHKGRTRVIGCLVDRRGRKTAADGGPDRLEVLSDEG